MRVARLPAKCENCCMKSNTLYRVGRLSFVQGGSVTVNKFQTKNAFLLVKESEWVFCEPQEEILELL